MKKPYILLLIALIVVVGVFNRASLARAGSVNVTVNIGIGPQTIIFAKESITSSATNPTNAGAALTFTATATNQNDANYYLAICKTDEATGNVSSYPTCLGGEWCISLATESGEEASCSYTTLSTDVEENAWYAYVCDGDGTTVCTSAQGSGDPSTPFYVNHAPSFSAISNNSPQDPGGTVTWTSNASDSDTNTTADSVKLLVCKTQGVSSGECDGGSSDSWCSSSLSSSNPSCSYTLSSYEKDATHNAYAYIVDNHNHESASSVQGENTSFTVTNKSPTVSGVTLNGGDDIVLVSGTSTPVVITATVTDTNSCSDNEIASVTASLYRSSIGYLGCNTDSKANDQYCYPNVACTAVTSGNTCQGEDDASVDYSCSIPVAFFADPTDSDTPYSNDDWKVTVLATDDNGSASKTEVSTGVELLSLIAITTDSVVPYGEINAGQTIDPLSKFITVTSFGNTALDVRLSGTAMSTSTGDTIPVDSQRYATSIVSFENATALTNNFNYLDLDIKKPTSISGSNKKIYWGISVPFEASAGIYNGVNSLVAVKKDAS